jgi:hypothetical protein
MEQAVSRRPLTKQDRIWSKSSPPGTCGGERGFLRVFQFFPVSIIPTMFHTDAFIVAYRLLYISLSNMVHIPPIQLSSIFFIHHPLVCIIDYFNFLSE